MKDAKVTLIPLMEDDREQFILDNQWAFKYGAMMEFGERDDHIDDDGEIISRNGGLGNLHTLFREAQYSFLRQQMRISDRSVLV